MHARSDSNSSTASGSSVEGAQAPGRLVATGALLGSPLFRCNSVDRDRERRRRRRQWQRRRRTVDSNGDTQSGTETSPEDMLETDEPSSMFEFEFTVQKEGNAVLT